MFECSIAVLVAVEFTFHECRINVRKSVAICLVVLFFNTFDEFSFSNDISLRKSLEKSISYIIFYSLISALFSLLLNSVHRLLSNFWGSLSLLHSM